jgi:hypothetical protein
MGPLVDQRSPGSFADTLQRDPEAWALRINSAWRRSLESVIETGRLLIDAKANLVKRGQWEQMIGTLLDFSPDTAQRLMAIARDERLTNPAHVRFLPRSYSTLHLLTKVPDEQFARGLAEKIINPDMERKDVDQLRPERIPEPAESGDPDQNVAGGPLERPSMAAEQSGEQDAGETTEAGASGSSSPALLAPVDPAAVEGASSDASTQAPPAVLPGGGLAIAHRRVEPGDSLDFFPTPPWATRALIEHVFDRLGRRGHCGWQVCWEPACGEGHMAEPLGEYFREVVASDIKDYGYGDHTVDFLKCEQLARKYDADWIITNPPFNDSAEFVLKALQLAGTGVAMFVRLSWLESVKRYNMIFRDNPPTLVSIFSERVPLHKGRWEDEGSTMTAYTWLTWINGASPQAPFWIPPGCREALTKPDDATRFGAKTAEAAE